MATLSDLQTDLTNELARGTAYDSYRTGWINHAQKNICWEDAFRFLRATDTMATAASTRSVSLPSGCGTVLRIEYDDVPVVPTSRSDLMRMYDTADEGEPKHYERTNGAIDVFPLPDAIYALDIWHLSIFTDLSGAGDSNALTTGWPDLVVYGAKILAAQFLPDPELEEVAKRQYREEMRTVHKATLRRDQAPLTEMGWSPDVKGDKGWRI